MRRLVPLLAASLALAAPAAWADIVVRFVEGAPTDRFEITNDGMCAVDGATLVIDLSSSFGRLVFDVTTAGPGVNVAQPLRVADGAAAIAEIDAVTDGDRRLALTLTSLGAGATIVLTADLDDTLPALGGQTIVSGAEIAGASAEIAMRGATSAGLFDATGVARAPFSGCAF